jgi:hypothetical protein
MPVAMSTEAVASIMTVTLLLVISVTAVSITFAVFAARRRYRKTRARVLAAFIPGRGGSGALASSMRALPAAQPGWWSVQRERRQLWQSVQAAEHAVASATAANAPVGDLPRLVRQLRGAADAVDVALQAGSRAHTHIPDSVHTQRAELQRTANEISRSALDSLATTSHGPTHDLSHAVKVEAHSLAAGLRSAYRTSGIGR